jgi:hypothetical protein
MKDPAKAGFLLFCDEREGLSREHTEGPEEAFVKERDMKCRKVPGRYGLR